VRKTFDLPQEPLASATLHITADNVYTVFVNGTQVGTDDQWNAAEQYDVARHLRPGRNVLAARVRNQGGPGGLLAWLRATTKGNAHHVVATDGTWRLTKEEPPAGAKTEPPAWTLEKFDDAKWSAAHVLGGAHIGPWNIAAGPGGGSGGGSAPGGQDVAKKNVTTYRPASEEIADFILPEGFGIELVASDPLIINPVCLTLDEQGRIYVAESHSYRYGPSRSPVQPSSNPIVRLDPAPDGQGFVRTLVAEGFDDPCMGLAVRDGKLWCTSNQFLYRFDLDPKTGKGTNRTTLAVDRNKAWNPFGLFVLEWGPEGDLYLSVGNHDIDLQGPNNKATGRGSSGIVVRMRPDARDMQRLVHGLRVPYSFEYDPFGQLWVLSNGEGNPNRFVRVIDGVDYHCYSRNQVGQEWLAGRHPLAPPCQELPRGACTQLLRYYGSAFPASYQGSLFLDNWGAHGFGGVNRALIRYVPDERGRIVHKEDWLLCRDPHFRCSHVVLDPQGNLLVADWYGRDDESDLTGRIWRVTYEGKEPRPRSVPANAAPGANGATGGKGEADALAALGSPDHLARQKAGDALVAKGSAAVAGLSDVAARSATDLGGAGALWCLVRIGTPDALRALEAGTRHGDWKVRRLALQLLRRHAVPTSKEVATKALGDPDPAVRLEASLGLGEDAAVAEALLGTLRAGAAEDEHLRYEAAWHLARTDDGRALAALLDSREPDLRTAGLVALDVAAYEKFGSAEAASKLLADRLGEPGGLDPELLFKLADLNRSEAVAVALTRSLERTDLPAARLVQSILLLRSMGKLTAGSLGARATQGFLQAVREGRVDLKSGGDVLLVLQLLRSEGPTDFTLAQVGRHLGHADAAVVSAAHELARAFGRQAAPLTDALWVRLLDPKTKPEDRLRLIGTLQAVETQPDPARWRKLLADADPVVARDAVRSWRAYATRPELRTVLEESVLDAVERNPELKPELTSVLRAFGSDPTAGYDEAAFRERGAAVQDDPARRDDKLRQALGRRVFERSGCVKCHVTVDADVLRAPSLKGIGKEQKTEYLVESVLEPSKVIKTGFLSEVVTTKTGRVLTGLVKEEGDRLRIVDADKETVLPKSEVDERAVQKKSIMPDGLAKPLGAAEFEDLMLYLRSLK
jgi:putative heme-binding domain-containing protein